MKKRKYTTEQIISIPKECDAAGNVSEVCRKHGTAATTYYGWEAIIEATREALSIGKPSAEHVLNLLTHLKERGAEKPAVVSSAQGGAARRPRSLRPAA